MYSSLLKRGLASVFAAALLFGGHGEAAAAGERLTFATQEAGSSYHTLGTGISKMLTEQLGRPVTVQPYGGSTVYLPLIDNGEATLAFISSIDSGDAFSARGLKGLRAVARIIPFPVAFMARANSGIKDIADLKGKRVVIDFKAMLSMSKVTRAMLASGDLSDGDVDAVTVGGIGEGNTALIEGNVDATFLAVGIPLVQQAHAAVPGGVRYVNITGPRGTNAFLHSHTPGLYTFPLQPGPGLPEVGEPVTVSAFDTFLITGKGTPDADVAAVLAALYDHFDGLQKDYPKLGAGQAAEFSAPTNAVPYHPAAIAYYKSKGMWTQGNEANEKALSGN